MTIRRSVLCAAALIASTAVSMAQEPQPKQTPPPTPPAEQEPKSVEQRLDDLEQRLGPKGEEKADPNALKAFWKDGLRLETNDKNVQLQLGGRVQVDWAWFDEDDDLVAQKGNSQDGTEFRRARLNFQGLLYRHLEFKTEYDFARRAATGETGGPGFRDVYLGAVDIPVVGNTRVGHFKEPFSLDEMTTDTDVTFMEKSLASVFAPSRNTGFGLYDAVLDQRATWAAGVFRDDGGDNFGYSQEDGKYNVTARLTGLPWYEDEGRHLLHLGVAASHRNPNGNSVRFRQRPEANLANRYVDTGALGADDVNEIGVEAAVVLGPLSVQGEFMGADVDAPAGASGSFFSGYYVQASYFLTGEFRPYDRARGVFGRLVPKDSLFGGKGGGGAWEVAARYSHLDLDDSGVNGGTLSDITGGVNWYMNANFRVTLNYIFSQLEDVGDAHIGMVRFQVVF